MPAPPAALPVLVLAALGAAFALLTCRATRQIGRSPVTFGRGDTAHDFLGRAYAAGSAVLFAFLAARAVAPAPADAAASPIAWLSTPLVGWAGVAVMVGGAAVILTAQAQMGTSWRVELDPQTTALATHGLFRVSRNPIFLGLVAVVLGVFLAVPTALTFGALVAAWLALSVQIRLEEEHLRGMHGQAYDAYRASVPRWVGLQIGNSPTVEPRRDRSWAGTRGDEP